MRAVRALRAALVLGLAGFAAFLPVVLLAVPASFVDFLAAGAGFLVFCAVFFAGVFALVEAEPAGLVVELPVVWPVTGSTIIKQHSKTARQPNARRKTKVGKDVTLISSL